MCSEDPELGLDTQSEMNRAPAKMTGQWAAGTKGSLRTSCVEGQ